MFESVVIRLRRGFGNAFAAALVASLAVATSVSAQTTVVLNQAGSQVTDTTIRSGSGARTNFDGGPLITRRSDDPEWHRRAILKFDTKNFIPAGAKIASATLTLTVKSGLGSSGATRPLRAWRIASPFQEADATWMIRQETSSWGTPGGDLGEAVGSANASNVAGAKVNINVTALVQNTSDGDFGSRYTRVMLADVGADDKESYREYYASEEPTVSRRPTLTIVLGSTTTDSTSGTTSGSTLKVLQWNIAQGYGQDGKSNIDRVAAFIAAKRPDVISFNEIMRYSSSSQPQMIADKLRALTGQTWTYKWVQKSGSSSGEGVCVMTRLAIDGTASLLLTPSRPRSVAMVSLNVNGRNVNVFSTHLDHEYSSVRLAQVKQLVPWAATFAEQRIVAGDFNWYPGTTEINEMAKTYRDGWAVAVSQNDDVAYADNPNGNTRNNRIDYVWYSRDASALTVTQAQVYDTRDSSGKKPSDHNPLMVTFQVR